MDLGKYESETIVGSVGRSLCLVPYVYGILVTAFIEHRYLRFKPCKSLSLALVSESDVKNLWFILPDVANRAVT